MTRTKHFSCRLPERPNAEYYRKQAKYLYRDFKAQQPIAKKRFSSLLASRSRASIALVTLSDAQTVIAREHGCSNWQAFLCLIHKYTHQNSTKLLRKQFADELYALKKINSPKVHSAFSEVPREEFIGAPPWRFPEFYWYPYLGHVDDRLENIYQDRQVNSNQRFHLCNGIPSTQAKWIEALNPVNAERVLHIGCDNGYYTAILAQLVGLKGELHFFDKNPDLKKIAKTNLAYLGQCFEVQNIESIYKTHSFDVILINAGVRRFRSEWLDALKDGGRILVSMIASYADIQMGYGETLLIKKTNNNFRASFIPAGDYSSDGYYSYYDENDSREDKLIKDAFSRKGYKSVRSLRLDSHQCDDSCWLHQESYCLSKQAA
tara:strand:+ start:230 stop:1357 length:1128 start_codon:yes stop_codon:yes gene_type:complete